MKNLIICTSVILLGLSLSVKGQIPPPSWPEGSYSPDTINIEQFILSNDLPLISEEPKVRQRLGYPDTTWFLPRNATLEDVRGYDTNKEFLSKEEFLKRNKGQSTFPKATLRYDSLALTISLREGYAYVSSADWRKNPALVIEHPKITLSSETTLEDIQKAFPNSYDWRNGGRCNFCGFFVEDYENFDRLTFVRLHDYGGYETEHPLWSMELDFIDGKLAFMYLSKRNYYLTSENK